MVMHKMFRKMERYGIKFFLQKEKYRLQFIITILDKQNTGDNE